MKKVSLILTTYNCSANLKRTLASIDKQDYPLIEVCIADSCSCDGTIDIIKEYAALQMTHSSEEKLYKEVVWKSEKDSGIYDGLNHSLALASGDYLLVMNDELTKPDAISILVNALEECERVNPEKNILGVHSDLVYASESKIIRTWRMGQGNLYFGWMPAHPTLMLKASVYKEYGLYDTSYISAADYEYMIRFLKDKRNVLAYVPQTLVSMFYGGTSSGGLYNYWRSITESLRALRQNHVHFGLWITFLRTIRVALQFFSPNK